MLLYPKCFQDSLGTRMRREMEPTRKLFQSITFIRGSHPNGKCTLKQINALTSKQNNDESLKG